MTEKTIEPTADDIQSAKEYVRLRNDYSNILGDRISDILSDLAAQIVTICYKYNVDPKRFTISEKYNKQMMREISAIMDDAENEIYDLILDFSAANATDEESKNALLAWLVLLGKGKNNLRDTLHGYLFKFMKDLEAAIAAMRYMGVSLADAITKIRTYLFNIYMMPEVLTAMRNRGEFAATYIFLGGVQPGSVGISNNGSKNVVNMGKITMQMGWMRWQGMDFQNRGAIGYMQYRGSNFHCDICDSETGFHPDINEIFTKSMPHPHCMCFRVPLFL